MVGKISPFFIVGKYSDFFLLRSRFVPFIMDSKNSKYSPLPHRFKRIFHGFLLASFSTSSRVQYCFSRASLVLRFLHFLFVRSLFVLLFVFCSLRKSKLKSSKERSISRSISKSSKEKSRSSRLKFIDTSSTVKL